MKHMLVAALMLMAVNTYAKCEATVSFNLFSNPLTNIEEGKNYDKVLKEISDAGYQKPVDGKAIYNIHIEAGIERFESEATLHSHITVINNKGDLKYETYKNRSVKADKFMTSEQILKFVKRHVRKDLATCGL